MSGIRNSPYGDFVGSQLNHIKTALGKSGYACEAPFKSISLCNGVSLGDCLDLNPTELFRHPLSSWKPDCFSQCKYWVLSRASFRTLPSLAGTFSKATR